MSHPHDTPGEFSVFYISLLLPPPPPAPSSFRQTHLDSSRHTNTPSGGCTYSPSDRQSWSPPTQKLKKHCWYCHQWLCVRGVCLSILIMCHSRGVGKCVWQFAWVHACVPCLVPIFFLLVETCESVYLFRSLCACVFVFESSNVSEIFLAFFHSVRSAGELY